MKNIVVLLPSLSNSDYWAGAQKACIDQGMVIPKDTTALIELYNTEWEGKPTSGTYWSGMGGRTKNHLAWMVDFSNGVADYKYKISHFPVLCVNE